MNGKRAGKINTCYGKCFVSAFSEAGKTFRIWSSVRMSIHSTAIGAGTHDSFDLSNLLDGCYPKALTDAATRGRNTRMKKTVMRMMRNIMNRVSSVFLGRKIGF